jgi:hypothetical protein
MSCSHTEKINLISPKICHLLRHFAGKYASANVRCVQKTDDFTLFYLVFLLQIRYIKKYRVYPCRMFYEKF